MLIYLSQLLGIILICIILAILYFKYVHLPKTTIHHNPPQNTVPIKYKVILISVTIFFYCFLAFLLSLSWLGGDDFFFPPFGEPLTTHLHHVAWKYCNWVSRFGEIIVGMTGVSENRWQHFIFTPIFVILLPYAIFRLVSPKGSTIFNLNGIFFYILTLTIFLIQPAIGANWRNFRCYAAATNYLWPLLGITFFLSFYRNDQKFNQKSIIFSTSAMFALGMYAGWSIECITCFLLPAIIGISIWKLRSQRFQLPQFSGLLGLILGSFLLFGSPALAKRAASAKESCSIAVEQLSFSEAFELASNITPQNMHILSGGAITAYLGDFPIVLRALFLPHLISEYLPCCFLVLLTCLVFIITLCFTQHPNKKHIIIITLCGITLSFLCSASYLTSCIPNRMSFLPPLFILLCVLGYLSIKASRKLNAVLAIISLGYWLYISIPATVEAYSLLPARQTQMQLIHEKIATGEQDLHLPYPFIRPPIDQLHIIQMGVFKENPESYPNHLARSYFKVRSIRSICNPDTKHCHTSKKH